MRSAGAGWNPWRELRAREHLIFRRHSIGALGGGALYVPAGDRAVIVLDVALDFAGRRCALAHELVHDERGGVIDEPDAGALGVLAVREEQRVHAIVAERLVPDDDLAEFARVRGEVEPITAGLVAEEFDVTQAVASEAMQRLARRQGTRC